MSTHVEPGPRMPLVGSAVLAALAENWWLLLYAASWLSPLV